MFITFKNHLNGWFFYIYMQRFETFLVFFLLSIGKKKNIYRGGYFLLKKNVKTLHLKKNIINICILKYYFYICICRVDATIRYYKCLITCDVHRL